MKSTIQVTNDQLVKFLFSGHSVISLYKIENKHQINFRVRRKQFAGKKLYEIACCMGENFEDHSFTPILGYDLQANKYYGNVYAEQLPAKTRQIFAESARWMINKIVTCKEIDKTKYIMNRPNTCQRCGKTVEELESLESGYGPECKKKVKDIKFWWQKALF